MISSEQNSTTVQTPAPDAAPTTSSARRGLSFGRRPVAIAAAGALVLLSAGGAFAASAHKTVEIDVDGESRTVSTFSGSVESVLAQAGVTVGEKDQVAPAIDAMVVDGSEIVVRHAIPVMVTIDGSLQTVWTTASSTTEALGVLAASGRNASAVASRSAADGRQTLDLPVTDGGAVSVVVDGQTIPLSFEASARLAEVLEAAGVTLGDLDRVHVTAAADGSTTVTIVRINAGDRVETVAVPFPTREESDATMYVGERKVLQAGANGSVERTFRTVTVDGVEVYASAPLEVVLSQAVEQVVAVGTKARPAVVAAAGAGTYVGDGVWGALAQCESGGNPAAVSASGTYHGLYQFSVGTWAAVGGSGLPSQASPAEQTQRAQILQARSGWGQWPACAAKLGLL